jgi:hypothetical protein
MVELDSFPALDPFATQPPEHAHQHRARPIAVEDCLRCVGVREFAQVPAFGAVNVQRLQCGRRRA